MEIRLNKTAAVTFNSLDDVVSDEGQVIQLGDHAAYLVKRGIHIWVTPLMVDGSKQKWVSISHIDGQVLNCIKQHLGMTKGTLVYTLIGESLSRSKVAVIPSQPVEETMGSHEIAELTGKRHSHVRIDTKKVLTALGLEVVKYSSTYQSNNGEQPCYRLPSHLVKTVITGYDVVLRNKVIQKLEALEKRQPKEISTSDLLRLSSQRIEELETTVVSQAVEGNPLAYYVGGGATAFRARQKLVEKGFIELYDPSNTRRGYRLTDHGSKSGIGCHAIGSTANSQRILYTPTVLKHL